ncbi:MAG TPA: hypothetical protein VNK43_05405 [Gemmatimonadales bacterium]|nr:hypothetical protein [Gemmatimonadales bacterium]
MEPLVIVLRLVHVVCGVLWVGMALFNTFFLGPALQEAGPAAGKVMEGLQRRRLMTITPLLAVATLLSGVWLFWRASLGFSGAFLRSPVGHTFALGGVAAIAAFVIGMTVARPAMMRAGALAQRLAGAASEGERQAMAAELGRLRARGATSGRLVAALLLVATAAMAVARYL